MNDLRPCKYFEQKALFHGFEEVCRVSQPSMMVPGSIGGQIKETFAIIELENGQLIRVPYHQIIFCDSSDLFKNYTFEKDE